NHLSVGVVPGAGGAAGGCGSGVGSTPAAVLLMKMSMVSSTEVIVAFAAAPAGMDAGGWAGVRVSVSCTAFSDGVGVGPSANSRPPGVSCAHVNTLSVALNVISVPPAAAVKKRIAALERVNVPVRGNAASVRKVTACRAGLV